MDVVRIPASQVSKDVRKRFGIKPKGGINFTYIPDGWRKVVATGHVFAAWKIKLLRRSKRIRRLNVKSYSDTKRIKSFKCRKMS
tara:strand:+ start:171 stop:422 length:252 start_codon:yes stop_codon:yes gene_type:complete